MAPALIAILALKLNTWGIFWGMPSVVSWAPDTIAASRTLYTIGHGPTDWPTHYPPLHFYVNRLLYAPILRHWQHAGQVEYRSDGSIALAGPLIPKLALLTMLSRGLTAAMSVCTVLILIRAARVLFSDSATGWFAGLTLATCAEWVFFSHLGNLDIPHMFWFAWSLYAYIRAWQTDRTACFALLGVLTALSVSTKDAVAGAYVGILLTLALTRFIRRQHADRPVTARLFAVVHPKMLLGLSCFLLPYAIIHGLFIDPHAYLDRLAYYLTGPGVRDFNRAYQGPAWLAREAFLVSVKALGWPALAAMIAATVYGLLRCRPQSAVLIAPVVSYYIVVCSYTGMVYARMLFPAYICLAILVGRACALFLSCRTVPAALRITALFVLFGGSVGYCAAVDLELLHDSRYRAEQWLDEHVPGTGPIGVFSDAQYLPRFTPQTHQAVLLAMRPQSFSKRRPRYLILTSFNYEDYDEAQRRCMRDLLSGVYGYSIVARFSKRYLPPAAHWIGVAGWGTRGAGKASPDIIILCDTAGARPETATQPCQAGI